MMIRDIDDAFKPSEISLKAKAFIDKMGTSKPVAVDNEIFTSRKQMTREEMKTKDCHNWVNSGKCKWGRKCYFRHLPHFENKENTDSNAAVKPPANQKLANHVHWSNQTYVRPVDNFTDLPLEHEHQGSSQYLDEDGHFSTNWTNCFVESPLVERSLQDTKE